MILVQNVMLIKNHVETLGLKINRNEVIHLQKVLKNLEVTMMHEETAWFEHHHSLAMFKNKLKKITKITQHCWQQYRRMKVKSKSHHKATGIEHPPPFPPQSPCCLCWKLRCQKIFERKAMMRWFYALFVQRRPGSHMCSRILELWRWITLFLLIFRPKFLYYMILNQQKILHQNHQ